MKLFSFIAGLILFVSPVLAQENPSPLDRPGYKVAPEIRQIEKKAKDQFDVLKKSVRPASQEKKEEKLQKVKSEQKRKIVERVSRQINELNARMMNHFSQALDRLEKVLANIVSRVAKAEANNWDVSAVRAMITSAEEAIASARTAIQAQATKSYAPEITGQEEKLRIEVGEARKALHSDLVMVKEKVKAAHEFVKAVAKALAQSPRIDQLNSPQKDESR